MSERISTWKADRNGLFQGTPSIGEMVDAVKERLGKPLKIKPLADHWSMWEEGEPMAIDEAELAELIADGQLPDKGRVTYVGGKNTDDAKRLVRKGTHVIVEMLDPVRKLRLPVNLVGGRLIAKADQWEATKAKA